MLQVSNQLKDKILELNGMLNKKYESLFNLDKRKLRKFVEKNVGRIEKVNKLSSKDLEKYSKGGGIVGVDGSKNKFGGAYPHFIEVFQSLAKSTTVKDSPIYMADFYTPLYLEKERDIISNITKENPTKEDINSFLTKYKLSSIEVEVAIKAAEELKPLIIMMDGSLIRYKIEASDKWNELKRICEERGIILIGIIKDIKTNILGNSLNEHEMISNSVEYLYDRELLYGILEYGEMLIIEDKNIKKYEEGLSPCFIRASKEPTVIGIDLLNTQGNYIKEMAQLVLTLTPEKSRGVPLWIDIIDSEVRISDKMLYGLLEKFIDRKLLEKLFVSERSKRTL